MSKTKIGERLLATYGLVSQILVLVALGYGLANSIASSTNTHTPFINPFETNTLTLPVEQYLAELEFRGLKDEFDQFSPEDQEKIIKAMDDSFNTSLEELQRLLEREEESEIILVGGSPYTFKIPHTFIIWSQKKVISEGGSLLLEVFLKNLI